MAFDVGDIEGRLLLDINPFQAGLDQARADGAQFANETFTARLGLDQSLFNAQLAGVLAKLDSLGTTDLRFNIDQGALDAQLAQIRGAVEGLASLHPTATVDLDTAPADAALDALEARLDAFGRESRTATARTNAAGSVATDALAGSLGGGGFGGSLLSALLAGTADQSLQEMIYGGEPGGFLAKVLSPATMLTTLFSAQFGSLGSLMGFGPEHLLTTLLGVGGLATGGAMGAGLLGLGSLGKSLVGSGSDALVNHVAMQQVETLVKAYTTLKTAVAEYGKASTQAKTAQIQLTHAMQAIPPVARQALLSVAESYATLDATFHKAIGTAEVASASIMKQVLTLGQTYVPLVAEAAQRNLSIINTGLKPLFSWLEGPQGIGIFEHLETEFAHGLPTSLQALDQGLELFLRVINLASTYTGGLTEKLDAWFKRMNGATFSKVSSEVTKLINDFHIVENFLKALGDDIVDVFKNDAGTATAVIEKITTALTKLGQWINSTGGISALKKLFTVHKGETLELMQTLGELLVSFGKVYLAVAPYFVQLVTDVLQLANAFFAFTQSIPGIAELTSVAIALFIMQERAHTLTTALSLLRSAWNFGQEILAMIGYIEGAGQSAQTAGQWFTGLKTSMHSVSSESDTMTTAIRDGMTQALQNAGVAADNTAVSMQAAGDATEDVGDAAEDAAGGFGGLMGILGAGGLIAGSVGIVGALIGTIAHLGHSSVTVGKVNEAVTTFSQTLAELPVTSVVKITADLITLHGTLGGLEKQLRTLQPDTTAFTTLAGKIGTATAKMLTLSRGSANLQGNLAALMKAFGLSKTQVQQYATGVVTLTKHLTTGKVKDFAKALRTSGTAAMEAKGKMAVSASSIVASATQMAVTVASKDRLLVTSMKVALASRVALAQDTAPRALAALVNGTQGGLAAVEAIDRKWGVTIPATVLGQLRKAMGQGGVISMAALTTGIKQGGPAVEGAGRAAVVNRIADLITPTKKVAAQVGVTTVLSLVKALTSKKGTVSTHAADVITAALTSARSKAKTFDLIGAAIAGGISQGIIQHSATAAAAVSELVNHIQVAAAHAADIHSPSGLFRATIGMPIGQGVAVGITDATADVVSAAQSIVNAALRGARGNLTDAGAGLLPMGSRMGAVTGDRYVNAPVNVTISGADLSSPDATKEAVHAAIAEAFETVTQLMESR